MVQQLCTEFQTLIESMYRSGRLSKTEAMFLLDVNEHTMFNRHRKDIRLKTLYTLCVLGLTACHMEFNHSELLRLIAYCCEHRLELVVSVRSPDQPKEENEVTLLSPKKKQSGKTRK